MSIRALKSACLSILSDKERIEESNELNDVDVSYWINEPIFCQYQIDVILDKNPVVLWEKSRQIGASYSLAFLAVMKAISDTKGTVVSSYNRDAVKNFITDCAKWAKLFNNIFTLITYTDVINERDICVFELKFLNGRKIIGLAGDSVQFRSYTGANYDAIVDEAAYRDDLQSLLAAVLGLLIHGGQIHILSTHAGIDNQFNLLCKKVVEGLLPYSHHKTTFRDAVNQGLYKRIVAKTNTKYLKDEETKWVNSIYSLYGNRSGEELDVEPSDYSQEGKLFNNFQKVNPNILTEHGYYYFRSHDLASTEDDKNDKDTAFYSASVKVAYNVETKQIIIVDWLAEKLAPLEGDNRILELAKEDGECYQIIEIEPGSTGAKYLAIMQEKLSKEGIYTVDGYRPYTSKIKRLIPVANAVLNGELVMLDIEKNYELEKLLRRVSKVKKPLITDLADCLSNVYSHIHDMWNSVYD